MADLISYDSREPEEEGVPYPKITVVSVNEWALDKEKKRQYQSLWWK
jgi:hypothetical protein